MSLEDIRNSRTGRMVIWSLALTIVYYTMGFDFVVVVSLALILAE